MFVTLVIHPLPTYPGFRVNHYRSATNLFSFSFLYSGQSTKPQLLLFSATVPDWVSRTAGKYMNKNKKVVDMIGQDKVKTAIAVEVHGYVI